MSHQHKKPITRRDFLAAGMLPFAAQMLMPNWVKLLATSPEAYAATNCPVVASNGMIPLIQIDASGGWSVASNVVPLDKGGQLLTSYNQIGLGSTPGAITTETGFANKALFPTVTSNGFFRGLKTTATAPTIANTTFHFIPCASTDDTSGNPSGMGGMISAAGALGSQLPPLGTSNTPSGGNGKFAAVIGRNSLFVPSKANILNAIGYAAALGNLNANQKATLAKTVASLTQEQTNRLMASKNGADVKTLLDCAGIKNQDLLNAATSGAPSTLDPLSNAEVATAWGITTATAATARANVFGSIAYNVITGNSAYGNLAKGGYDYHGNARTATDTMDADVGADVGRILETARILGRPVVIAVTTDGAVSNGSTTATGNHAGDSGTRSGAFMLTYNPTGANATTTTQIGYYTNNQVADVTFVAAKGVDSAVAAIFANWLKLNNKLNLFDKIAGGLIPAAQLNSVIVV